MFLVFALITLLGALAKFRQRNVIVAGLCMVLTFLGMAGLFLVPALKPVLIPLFWFLAKAGSLVFLFVWIRGTLPRFRYDQLMRFAWTFLFPVAVVNLLITSLLLALTAR